MTELTSRPPEGVPEPVAPFRPPAWGRALGIAVIALILIAAIFSLWVMYTYWDSIAV